MMIYRVQPENGRVTGYMQEDGKEACTCIVSVDQKASTWDITGWYTKEGFRNKGIGAAAMSNTLREVLRVFGEPSKIQYTWNGENSYVLEWMERHFGAVCNCPLAVQKTASDDDWDSHIYDLDKDEFLRYFGLLT